MSPHSSPKEEEDQRPDPGDGGNRAYISKSSELISRKHFSCIYNVIKLYFSPWLAWLADCANPFIVDVLNSLLCSNHLYLHNHYHLYFYLAFINIVTHSFHSHHHHHHHHCHHYYYHHHNHHYHKKKHLSHLVMIKSSSSMLQDLNNQLSQLILEGVKMMSNIWFVGSAVTLQSEWYTWLQVEHGSITKSDHMQISIKLAENL